MAVNEHFIDAPPPAVWDVLADPPSYEDWVVGNKEIRDFDQQWPAPHSEFQHKVGFGPVAVKDKTVSLESQPPHRLVINVRALPLGHGIVTFELREQGTGTLVHMEEKPAGGPAKYTWPLFDPLVRLRNAETLRRLARVAESRHRAGVGRG
jgi:uncharacterized protein YndB with AHSA1/START domain